MPFWRGVFGFSVIIQALVGFWMMAIVCYSGLRLTKLHALPARREAKFFKLGQYLMCTCGAVSVLYNWLPIIGCCVWRLHAPATHAGMRRRNIILQIWLVGCLLLTVGECIGIRYQIVTLPGDCGDAGKSPLLNHVGSIWYPDDKHAAVLACQNLAKTWRWTLPVIVFYGLVIVSVIFSFFEHSTPAQWPSWKPDIDVNLPPWLSASLRSLRAPIRFIWRCWCRSWPIAIALSIFTVMLPFILPILWIKELVKLTKDTKLGKIANDWQYHFDIDLEVFNAPVPDAPGSSPFEKVLSIDDLFFSICEFSHGRDIHALSQVSKTTNAIVKSHWSQHKKSMYKTVCANSGKTCYYCSIPCCDNCKALAYTIQLTTREMQRRTLQVMCSRCYMSELYAPNHFTSLTQKCPGNHHQNIFTDEDHNTWIWICRKCGSGVNGIRRAEEMRERYAKGNGVQLNAFSHHNCFSCERKVWKTSLRWWRCTECGLECRDKKFGAFHTP